MYPIFWVLLFKLNNHFWIIDTTLNLGEISILFDSTRTIGVKNNINHNHRLLVVFFNK